MLKDNEKLLKIVASHEIATGILTPEECGILERFGEELDRLEREYGFPQNSNKQEAVFEEAFSLVPGSKEALYKQTGIVDALFDTGRG